MHARSADALKATIEAWEPVLRGVPGRAGELAGDVYGVVDTIDSSAALRRALTDPGRSGEARAELARRLLTGNVADEVVDLVAGMVRRDWSAEADLTDAMTRVGDTTLMVSAEQAERLGTVVSELHGAHRLVDANPELRTALTDRMSPREQRAALVERLLGESVSYESVRLAARVFGSPRTNNPVGELVGVIDAAAARRDHLVASVRSAVPLDDTQIARLSAALERRYGKPVDVQVGIDPEVLGGLRVRVGADLIDDTIARRLEDVRRRLSA